jgi:hypothetical protein
LRPRKGFASRHSRGVSTRSTTRSRPSCKEPCAGAPSSPSHRGRHGQERERRHSTRNLRSSYVGQSGQRLDGNRAVANGAISCPAFRPVDARSRRRDSNPRPPASQAGSRLSGSTGTSRGFRTRAGLFSRHLAAIGGDQWGLPATSCGICAGYPVRLRPLLLALASSRPSLPFWARGNGARFRCIRGSPVCHRLPLVATAGINKRSSHRRWLLSLGFRARDSTCSRLAP